MAANCFVLPTVVDAPAGVTEIPVRTGVDPPEDELLVPLQAPKTSKATVTPIRRSRIGHRLHSQDLARILSIISKSGRVGPFRQMRRLFS